MDGPRLPRWRCGEPGCPQGARWQRVDGWGEYDPVDQALAELGEHYTRAHPDGVEEEVSVGGRALAA